MPAAAIFAASARTSCSNVGAAAAAPRPPAAAGAAGSTSATNKPSSSASERLDPEWNARKMSVASAPRYVDSTAPPGCDDR